MTFVKSFKLLFEKPPKYEYNGRGKKKILIKKVSVTLCQLLVLFEHLYEIDYI